MGRTAHSSLRARTREFLATRVNDPDLRRDVDALRVEVGRLHAARIATVDDLADAEFRVFSQFGEDGMIQWLAQRVPLQRHAFVEFGVQDYRESNTRFLVELDDWEGLIIDAGDEHRAFLERTELGWRHSVTAKQAFLTVENLNDVIRDAGFDGDVGLVSIDVDGVDYWLLEALTVVSPRILVVEYNSLFGPEASVTVPYSPGFDRAVAHHSGLCFGASLLALTQLANRKGYALVGSNSAGTNGFFVRRDVLGAMAEVAPADAWREARVRQARDVSGLLTYVTGHREQLALIEGCVVVDVESGRQVTVGERIPFR